MPLCKTDNFWGKPAPSFYMDNDEDVTLNAVEVSKVLNKARQASEETCHICGNNLVKTGGYIDEVTTCWDCMIIKHNKENNNGNRTKR